MLFSDYVRLARRSLALLWVFALLGAAGGLGWSLLQTPQYRSTTTVVVSARQAANLADLSQGADFTLQLVRSYAAIVPTAAVLQPAIRRTGGSETVAELAKHVEASTPLDTTVLQITVSDASPKRAAELANAISASLADVVEEITPPTADSATAVRLLTMEEATAASAPTEPRIPVNVAIGTAIGFALAVFLVVARDAVRRQDEDRVAQLERLPRPRRSRSTPPTEPPLEIQG